MFRILNLALNLHLPRSRYCSPEALREISIPSEIELTLRDCVQDTWLTPLLARGGVKSISSGFMLVVSILCLFEDRYLLSPISARNRFASPLINYRSSLLLTGGCGFSLLRSFL